MMPCPNSSAETQLDRAADAVQRATPSPSSAKLQPAAKNVSVAPAPSSPPAHVQRVSAESEEVEPEPQLGVVLADSSMHITAVNDGFCDITGYLVDEAVGRNCNFLQGTGTSKLAVQTIRDALTRRAPVRVALINYRKDGRAFWNTLSIYPMCSKSGTVQSYVGIQMVRPVAFVDRSLGLLPWAGPSIRRQRSLSAAPTESKSPVASQRAEQSPSAVPAQRTNVSFVAETLLPTRKGEYRVRVYQYHSSSGEKLDLTCIIHGQIEGRSDVFVRLHDQCFTSEVLGSLKCDCKEQLDLAMDYIREHDGMVIYLPQEGRGIGLAAKIKAYSLQEHGFDTVDANKALGFDDELREYGCVPGVLSELRIASIQLLTNNPFKLASMEALGVNVSGRVAVSVASNAKSEHYLATKKSRMGHML